MWDKVFEAVCSYVDDKDDYWEPVPDKVYKRAMCLVLDLSPLTPSPTSIYKTPDGNIMLQWGTPPSPILYMEVEEASIEIMITFPDRDPVFRSFSC